MTKTLFYAVEEEEPTCADTAIHTSRGPRENPHLLAVREDR